MNTFGVSSEELWDTIYRTDEAKLTFLAHMHNTSVYSSHAVTKAFDLSNFASCCDLGGKFRSCMHDGIRFERPQVLAPHV